MVNYAIHIANIIILNKTKEEENRGTCSMHWQGNKCILNISWKTSID